MISAEHDKLRRGAARLSVLSNTILIIAKLVQKQKDNVFKSALIRLFRFFCVPMLLVFRI